MNARRQNLIAIFATCIVTTVLLCTGLFWARWLLVVQRNSLLPQQARDVFVYASPQAGMEKGEDPNLDALLRINAGVLGYYLPHAELGIVDSMTAFLMEDSDDLDSNLYRWDPGPEGERLCYDPSLGLFVYERRIRVRHSGDSTSVQTVVLYAGPEGVSARPEERLGRFLSPIADRSRLRPQVVYDRGVRRFFAINWGENASGVRKGPELPKDVVCRPVQIGSIWKNLMVINLEPPNSVGAGLWRAYDLGENQVFILDASGRIDRLDVRTLDFAGVAGRLAAPPAPIGSIRNARPQDVAAYTVQAFEGYRAPPGIGLDGPPGEWVYGGCAVAALSGDGLGLRLDCFDANGQLLASNTTSVQDYRSPATGLVRFERPISSVTAAYYVLPGARTLTWMKFALESLHPPILVLASYFGGPYFEATAGYRSLLLLPDSFVAMIARGGEGLTPWEDFMLAFGHMLPGIVFLGLLAAKIQHDGVRTGMAQKARRAWIAATIVLGLPAYITYRLTRPKVSLVTCQNCGLERRPDWDKCHRCGSAWAVPELTPPGWRVLDEPEQAAEGSPSRTEEMGSPA